MTSLYVDRRSVTLKADGRAPIQRAHAREALPSLAKKHAGPLAGTAGADPGRIAGVLLA